MKIGILNAENVREELAKEYGQYPDMFKKLLHAVKPTLEVVSYNVLDGEFPESTSAVDGFLVTGSKLSVYDDVPWITNLGCYVQQLHKEKRKLVGICFGHQLISHFLGGKVAKSDKGWGIGRREETFTAMGKEAGYDEETFSLFYSHQDQVIRPPPDAKVLAASDFCPFAMIRLADHILTFQGHPEFSPGYAEGLFASRRQLFSQKHYQSAVESLKSDVDGLKVARWITDFFGH